GDLRARGVERMLLYEMLTIGIAVVLVGAVIGGLAARVMGSGETALLRDARAAAAQRRLVAAAAQQDDWIRRYLKLKYEDALAAPLSPRLATLITQLETQDVSA